MADTVSPSRRSQIMAGIGQRHTQPELAVRHLAHALGLRFRLHRRDLPGSPDLVFPKLRLALFVHGCFWHHHEGCRRAAVPKTREEYWKTKFKKNAERDLRNLHDLEERGWRAAVIWECELRAPASVLKRLEELTGWRSDTTTTDDRHA
jgi:DNA mismatch endonuclease, patch repair protein